MNAPETTWKIPSLLPSASVPTVFRPQRTWRQSQRELTLRNAEGGISLKLGEKLELDLGLRNANVRVRDESVLAADGSGTFQALGCGQTKIYVTGEFPNQVGAMHVPRKILVEIPVTVI